MGLSNLILPAGVAAELQYRNGSNFGAVGNVQRSSNDNLILTPQTTPGSLTSGELLIGSQKAVEVQAGGILQRLVGCIFSQTQVVTVTNTTTETSLVGSGVGTNVLPANFFVVGKTLRVHQAGSSVGAGSSGNVAYKVKVGTASAAATALVVSAHGAAVFLADWTATCTAVGASGSITIVGTVQVFSGAAAATPLGISATATIDTTGAMTIDATVAYTVASASISTTQNIMTIEALN